MVEPLRHRQTKGRGVFRKTTFHFFLIDERLVDSRTSRSALIRSSNTFTGSSFGSCGTSSPRKDGLIEMIDQFAGASGFLRRCGRSKRTRVPLSEWQNADH
jgi:hypothetical protein